MLKVNEIFVSIQGEGATIGIPAIFVRLSGCNFKCSFCDTDHHSFAEQTQQQILTSILKEKKLYPNIYLVIITGGEPLLQATEVDKLILCLQQEGFIVQIETNASIEWMPINGVHVVMSPKTIYPEILYNEKAFYYLKYVVDINNKKIRPSKFKNGQNIPIILMGKTVNDPSQTRANELHAIELCKKQGFTFSPRLQTIYKFK